MASSWKFMSDYFVNCDELLWTWLVLTYPCEYGVNYAMANWLFDYFSKLKLSESGYQPQKT